MFFVGVLIGCIIGGSICGIVVGAFCVAKNADLLDENDRLRGGINAQ